MALRAGRWSLRHHQRLQYSDRGLSQGHRQQRAGADPLSVRHRIPGKGPERQGVSRSAEAAAICPGGSRAVRSRAQLKQLLDDLYVRYGRRDLLSPSALSVPHRYPRREDREIAGFIVASLAYGNVKQIHRRAESALEAMGPSPARFVRHFLPARGAGRFRHFVHRFNTGIDLALLCYLLHQALERRGSLPAFFLAGYEPAHEDIGAAPD